MKNSHVPLALVGLSALSLLAAGCSRPSSAETQEINARASAPLDRVTASYPAVKPLALYTSQPGRIEAYEQAPLYSKVTGYVEEMLVDIGDAVQKDQPLVRLWIPEMDNELAQKQALVAQARADVRQTDAAVAAARAAVDSAAARVAQAEAGVLRVAAEYERWKSEHGRIEQLAGDGSVTRKLLDEALHQFRAAEAARQEAAAHVQAGRAALAEAEVGVAKAEADRGAAEARVDVAQANLAHTQTLIGYGTIRAPFDGVVTRRNVDRGHYVHPANDDASRPLLAVSRTDKVRVLVDVPEMEAALIHCGEEGDPAVVRVQALADREFQARVTRSSWSLNASNRSLRIQIEVDNPGGELRPGMYANAAILLGERPEALALPITAVMRQDREAYCHCVESGKIVRRRIELGLRSGGEVEILSGIDASQMVVLARPESLREGQLVEVIEPGQ